MQIFEESGYGGTVNPDPRLTELFRQDLLKPVIDRELRGYLPELLAGTSQEFGEAVERVLKAIHSIVAKISEKFDENGQVAMKLACTMAIVGDCNSVFPKDYEFALAVVFLQDTPGSNLFGTVPRSEVSDVDLEDGLLRIPVYRAKSMEDFLAGRRTISWLRENKKAPQ